MVSKRVVIYCIVAMMGHRHTLAEEETRRGDLQDDRNNHVEERADEKQQQTSKR